MRYDFSNFRCWLCCGLVYLFSFVDLTASSTASASGNGATAEITITSCVGPNEVGGYNLGYTIKVKTGASGGTNSNSASAAIVGVIGLSTTGFSQDLATSGFTGYISPRGTIGGVPYFLLDALAGNSGDTYENFFVTDQICPDFEYNLYLPGTDVMGTEYHVYATNNGPVDTQLYSGIVGYGATHLLSGTLEQFCGNIVTEKRPAGNYDGVSGGGWKPFTPPNGPPPDPPQSPGGPGDLPDGPDVPDSPGPGTDPTPPAPPSGPPSGGGGGDSELIEWAKDSNGVERGISERADVANEYLRQIRDNTSYVSDRLKTIDENTQTLADDVKRKADAEEAIRDATPSSSDMQALGVAAVAEVSTAMGTVTTGSAAPSGLVAPSFLITMPAMMGGQSFDLNPFRDDRLGPVVAFLKTLFAWLLVVGWAAWALKIATESGNVVMIAPQAHGNAVFAGTGGQATALVAATLITAIALSSITVIWAAWRDTNLQGLTVDGVLGVNPFASLSGVAGKIAWMLDQVLPLATIVAVLWARVTFRFYVYFAAYAAVTLKRFIVP